MSRWRWRWRNNMPYRLADPPTPHIPTVPPADGARPRADASHDVAVGVPGRQPRNRSTRFRDAER